MSLALASKPQVLENCPVLVSRTALFFELLKFVVRLKNILENGKTVFYGDRLKIFSEDLFFVCRALEPVSLVLGLEHSCSWPQEGLSSLGLSLALAANFFVSLALASSLVSSTSPVFTSNAFNAQSKYKIFLETSSVFLGRQLHK